MIKVFSSGDITKAVLVRDGLAERGIEADILNPNPADHTITGQGDPAVWITNDEDFDSARAVIEKLTATLCSPSAIVGPNG